MNKRFVGRMAPRAALAALAAGVASVQAAVPEQVQTELTAMKADGLVVAGAVLVAVIAIAAIKFIRKGL